MCQTSFTEPTLWLDIDLGHSIAFGKVDAVHRMHNLKKGGKMTSSSISYTKNTQFLSRYFADRTGENDYAYSLNTTRDLVGKTLSLQSSLVLGDTVAYRRSGMIGKDGGLEMVVEFGAAMKGAEKLTLHCTVKTEGDLIAVTTTGDLDGRSLQEFTVTGQQGQALSPEEAHDKMKKTVVLFEDGSPLPEVGFASNTAKMPGDLGDRIRGEKIETRELDGCSIACTLESEACLAACSLAGPLIPACAAACATYFTFCLAGCAASAVS